MKTPNFLRRLMTSPAYMDKNSAEYAAAERYLKILYPGNVATDASGRMVTPEYDMTLAEFYEAQAEMEHDLEEAQAEAEEAYLDATDKHLNSDACIVLEETIDVRVLMPDGSIEVKQLEVYTLDLPDFDNDDNKGGRTRRTWRWHSEDGENTCDECASRDGEIYESEDDIPEIPAHPNCRCTITEEEIDPAGHPVSVKPYKPKVPEIKSKQQDEPTKKDTFDKPVNVKPGQYLKFDGKTLTLYQDNKPVMSWDAVSGKPGFQSPEYQDKASTGPIPEGTYVARQEELQHINTIGALAGLIPGKHGEWPGGTISWGNSRVWLEPSKETNTFGRDGFSIHGGMWPGSAGCIDLTSQMDNFVALFSFLGNDLIVRVIY